MHPHDDYADSDSGPSRLPTLGNLAVHVLLGSSELLTGVVSLSRRW